MSTVVLARKYRPRTFAQLAGQEHVVRALGHALRTGRLHHAYLFTGTRGIGKTTVSRILAKSLNCTGADGRGGVTDEPCGVCPSCTQIDADRFIDYTELDAASNRSIDEIRDLIERAAYKPGVGRYKVFMIDEAHQLTRDAFNALLKTLEEPPEYLKFVLATTDPEKMLPTVLSRCLQFNLRPLAPPVVRDHLVQVLAAESVTHDEGSLRLLARAARGSMRDALSLTDQAIAFGGGQLEEAAVRAMLGAVDGAVAGEIVGALAAREPARMLQVVERLRVHGLSASSALEQVAQLLQQVAVEQAVPGALDDDDPQSAAARELAAAQPADETQLLYSIVLHGRQELQWMPDEYAGLTMVLLRFHALVSEPGSSSAGAPPAAPRSQPLRAPAPAVVSVPVPVATPATPAAPVTPASLATPVASAAPAQATAPAASVSADPALADRWHALVARLVEQGLLGGLTRELALQGVLVAITPGGATGAAPVWTLEVAPEPLRADALLDKLGEALGATLGSPVTLRAVAGAAADSPARREAAARARRQEEAEQAIRQDPLVQQVLSEFGTARIVAGSIRPA